MPSSFLQSAEWEAFERSLGRATWRVANGCLIIRHDLPFGFNYLYCPRLEGGITGYESGAIFFTEVKKIAKRERSVFLKIDPAEETETAAVLGMDARAGGTIRPSYAVQPRETIILDLAPSEENLLAAMREKTRYNIRLAERRGVSVTNQESRIKDGGIEIFWRLLRETAIRDGFRTHAREYYEKMFVARSDRFSNELFFAEYGGEILAAAIVNFYQPNQTATYLHGASSRSHRDVMAPHLLQWGIIQEAKRRGCAQYDFWGIDERRWPGVTRFKRGFGGHAVAYPQSIDIVYRPFAYGAYQIAKKIRS